jgi:hypothetical protein
MGELINFPGRLTLEQVKEKLSKLLGREVQTEKTKTGRHICKFLSYNAPMATLVGDTEEEAFRKLLQHVESRVEAPDPEPPRYA